MLPRRQLALSTAWALTMTPVVAVSLLGCAKQDDLEPMHLHFEPNHDVEPATIPADLGRSSTISDPVVGDFTVTVESVDSESVEFSTSEKMAPPGETDGINLNDLRAEFTVSRTEDAVFSTPTMDAGTTYTVSLVDGPA